MLDTLTMFLIVWRFDNATNRQFPKRGWNFVTGDVFETFDEAYERVKMLHEERVSYRTNVEGLTNA